MSKFMPAADRSPLASGAAGHAIRAYGSRDKGSSGVGVTTPAVILVVEDTEDLRCCVAEYLRVAGFEVIEAENARQALAAINAGIHIDLVFTDVNMPGAMDGAALARWMALNRPQLPVILTSGQSCPELELAGPCRRFVRKPYSLHLLEHDVREMVGAVVVQ